MLGIGQLFQQCSSDSRSGGQRETSQVRCDVDVRIALEGARDSVTDPLLLDMFYLDWWFSRDYDVGRDRAIVSGNRRIAVYHRRHMEVEPKLLLNKRHRVRLLLIVSQIYKACHQGTVWRTGVVERYPRSCCQTQPMEHLSAIRET